MTSTGKPVGRRFEKRGANRQTPAPRVGKRTEIFRIVEKLMSDAPRRVERRDIADARVKANAGRGLARVSVTISAIVRSRGVGRKSGIHPVSSVRRRPDQNRAPPPNWKNCVRS